MSLNTHLINFGVFCMPHCSGVFAHCSECRRRVVSNFGAGQNGRKIHAHARDLDNTGGERGSFMRNHVHKTNSYHLHSFSNTV